jgi:hypothetical protein
LPGAQKQQPKLGGVVEASRYFCGGAGETISIERLIAANDSRRRCSVAKEEQSEGNKVRMKEQNEVLNLNGGPRKGRLKLRRERDE